MIRDMATTDTRKKMIDEMREIMIKRAGITKKTIIDVAMANWTRKNLDLLTDAERRKYQSVIAK